MREFLLILGLASILISCKEGDISPLTDRNFAANGDKSFAQPEFQTFSELQSWLYANSNGNFTKGISGSDAFISIENADLDYQISYQFRYVDCFVVPVTIVDSDGEFLGVVDYQLIMANNKRELQTYPPDISDVENLLFAAYSLPGSIDGDGFHYVNLQNDVFSVFSYNEFDVNHFGSTIEVGFNDPEAIMYNWDTENIIDVSISGKMVCNE